MSLYFKQVVTIDASWSTGFGLMIDIPGINNMDTYRFIKQSMFSNYKSFRLKNLCNANDTASPKIHDVSLIFGEEWYNSTGINRKDMIKYNMADCVANLELCRSLDLITQILCLSYCSSSWIRDVLLYNTGDMTTSCICNNVYEEDEYVIECGCDEADIYYGEHDRLCSKYG